MEEKKCEFINECINFKENENLLTGDCHINELSIRCKNKNRCKYAIVYQQLQLKDKMIELMADYLDNQDSVLIYAPLEERRKRVLKSFEERAQQALAELEE